MSELLFYSQWCQSEAVVISSDVRMTLTSFPVTSEWGWRHPHNVRNRLTLFTWGWRQPRERRHPVTSEWDWRRPQWRQSEVDVSGKLTSLPVTSEWSLTSLPVARSQHRMWGVRLLVKSTVDNLSKIFWRRRIFQTPQFRLRPHTSLLCPLHPPF